MKSGLLLSALLLRSLQAEVNTANEFFTKAVRSGDLTRIETLLSSGFNPNLPVQGGYTPLYWAIMLNQDRVLDLLLAGHADPNLATPRSSPLELAIEIGAPLKFASKLIHAGAAVDAKGGNGRTALHTAVTHGRLDVMELLIYNGADVNIRDAEGVSPLDDAVWNGYLNAVAILLAHEARLNEPNPTTGATPINEASYRGNTAVVRFVLQMHPDLETRDKHGYSPLENAIRVGKQDSARLLLETELTHQRTPEFLGKTMDAVIRKNEPLLVETLLRHGAPANGTLPSGLTPLDAASTSGAAEIVRILLSNSADPNVSGPSGTTALEDAALKGFDAIAGMLLEHGALVNYINRGSGTTALYAAASFGKADSVKLLLDRGANPNLCGNSHRTPYQVALENGYRDVAAQIQNRGGTKTCRASADAR